MNGTWITLKGTDLEQTWMKPNSPKWPTNNPKQLKMHLDAIQVHFKLFSVGGWSAWPKCHGSCPKQPKLANTIPNSDDNLNEFNILKKTFRTPWLKSTYAAINRSWACINEFCVHLNPRYDNLYWCSEWKCSPVNLAKMYTVLNNSCKISPPDGMASRLLHCSLVPW